MSRRGEHVARRNGRERTRGLSTMVHGWQGRTDVLREASKHSVEGISAASAHLPQRVLKHPGREPSAHVKPDTQSQHDLCMGP